ncbi:MAG: hypothetical protein AAGL24_18685 [Pseudomonadota bacterium]
MSDEVTDPSARRKAVGLDRAGIGTAAFPPLRSAADRLWRMREDPVSRLLWQTKNPPSRAATPLVPGFMPDRNYTVRNRVGARSRRLPPAANTFRGFGSLRSYEPSLRDRAAWGVYDVLERFAAPNLGRLYAGRARQLVDFVPVLGDAVGVEEAGRDLYGGRYAAGTIGGLAAAIGLLPGVGDAVAKAARKGGRRIADRLGSLASGRASALNAPTETANTGSAAERPKLFDLPTVEDSGIEVAYGRKPETDVHGYLRRDMDGNPIYAEARRVVGRRHIDGSNEALGEGQYRNLAKDLTRRGERYVSPNHKDLRGDFGKIYPKGWHKKPDRIVVSSALNEYDKAQVLAHEMAHAIDFLGGRFETDGLEKELRYLYHAANTGRHFALPDIFVTPRTLGYEPSQVDQEHVAEALRSYIRNPAAMKKHFPRTAGRLRQFVNKNPKLSRSLHLNSMAALGGTGSAALLGRSALQIEEEDKNGI